MNSRHQSFGILIAMCFALLTQARAQPILKDAFKDCFRVGAALNESQFSERNTNTVALIKTQFNTISPENVLKWESVHPEPKAFNFEATDRYVAFGEKNHMFIVGHTLVWHSQTPKWVFTTDKGESITRDALLERVREHISTVVGRYRGRVKGWDVVNEALDEDGTLRKSPWRQIIGEDYLVQAFTFAHEADPTAELYYNDYSLENEPKRKGAIALIKNLQAHGIPITAVGLQGHYKMDWPTPDQISATITDFAKLGVKVMITELDLDVLPAASRNRGAGITDRGTLGSKVNPWTNGLPDKVQKKFAERYADLFRVFVKHRDAVTRVTFWGVTDGDSWLNNWPVRGRTSYPLLFDRDARPKPALATLGNAATKP